MAKFLLSGMMTTSLLKLETKYFVGSVIMSNRSRGFKFEYKTLNILKRNPNVIEALRSGGSHSLFDVIGFQANGIRLIQNKIDDRYYLEYICIA